MKIRGHMRAIRYWRYNKRLYFASAPLPTEPWQSGLAGEEFLHGGLLNDTFFGNQAIQPIQQHIHIV